MMERFAKGRVPRTQTVTLLAVLLAALLIGTTAASRSIATDEAFTWGIVAQPSATGLWEGLKFVGGNMAAYFVVVKAFIALDDSAFWLRVPSLVCAVGTIVLLVDVARRWFDEDVARRVAVLAATSVPLLYYGSEMRSYAFVALTSTWLWSLVGKGIDNDRSRDWILAGLASAFMILGHVISVLMLPWIGLVVLLDARGSLADRALRLVPIGLGVVPSVALIAVGDGAKTQWIPSLDVVSIARAGRFLLGDHAQFTDPVSGPLLVLLYAALFAIGAVLAVRAKDHRSQADRMAWMWFLGLPLTLVVVSIVEPLLWHRFLIPALPGALLVAARALGRLDRRVAMAALALIAILGVGRTVALRSHSADEYEELAAAIAAVAEPGDVLLASPPWSRAGLDYYWRNEAPVIGTPAFGPGFDRGLDFKGVDAAGDADAIWIIDRSESSQAWVSVDRNDDDFLIDELYDEIGSEYAVVETIEVQRFRAWRLVKR